MSVGHARTGTRATGLPPFIDRAFHAAVAEAVRHVGATAPNPPVGCAILDDAGEILCVGAHHRAGTPHAEARAIGLCRELGLIERARTIVVTLEPCNHTGRTGPCSQAIMHTPIRTVWIGAADPNPNVAGGGADYLRNAGCDVRFLSGYDTPDARWLAQQCRSLIMPFARLTRTGKAWITVKQALDATGSMIPPAGRTTFTSAAALDLAHRLRRATDAVVTATGTIATDRPGLDVRRIPDHPDRMPRLLAICTTRGQVDAEYADAARARGFDVRTCTDVRDLPDILGQAGAMWALVEAGPGLLSALREHDIWDDWLTIGVRPDGTETLDVAIRTGTDTPLRLFRELNTPKGTACFLGS
ncbi:bifunctional diaminohydroxyphosphoribosylaminopyrimidine deaminase/5-amino-6-(5-phosphoribosylamino)uracil reductase RibD [Novacetimonas pomaceti]|uniref:Riboflavin biosynthesis protein RibD n=1 Tax=Novacetimonas pomaceti TaxID=2021998 RepID=A0A318QC42_9PROT|nr:bifunctional diaminohydroxyphosphoribosylaminopyrimidine deaminase/5-amino-6-(5-phosphoribosylamino)uracil reductase RibD [Novacetimonas pomaceti]PYD75404.1 riboflavin biosynthesis protein RibD [Novacetimonas pomaceti]